MKRALTIFGALLLAVCLQSTANAFFIDFEDGVDGSPVNDITGISFQSYNGYTSIYADCRTGNYNCHSDDLGYGHIFENFHHNGNFSLWAGAAASAEGVIVDFTNNDGTWFTTGYSSSSDFYLEAYFTDSTSANVTGAANTNNPMGYLTITALAGQYIDYVVLHDTGNFWIVDDMSGDATGVNAVPEPSTLLLLGSGLLGLSYMRRRFAR